MRTKAQTSNLTSVRRTASASHVHGATAGIASGLVALRIVDDWKWMQRQGCEEYDDLVHNSKLGMAKLRATLLDACRSVNVELWSLDETLAREQSKAPCSCTRTRDNALSTLV